MKAFADILNKIKDFWSKAKKEVKILIMAGVVVLLVVVGFLVYSNNHIEYATLFSNLEAKEMSEIYTKLKDEGIPAKVSGNTIMVPSNQVDDLMLTFNAEGYPKTGLNYDPYFNNGNTFGETDADKAVKLKYLTEQNLTRTLERIDGVKQATVMLNFKEDSKYVLSATPPSKASAMVLLDLDAPGSFTQAQVNSVFSLIQKGVPGLDDPANIAVVDTKGNSYKLRGEGSGGDYLVSDQIEMQALVEKKLTEQIINLYTPIFGKGNISVSVAAKLNFDKKVTTSTTLTPVTALGEEENKGIMVSFKSMRELVGAQAGAAGVPGVDSNGGGTVQYPEGTDANTEGYYTETQEWNAEVNEIKEIVEAASGSIEDVTCTIILNGGAELAEVLPDVRKTAATAIRVKEENITVIAKEFTEDAAGDIDKINAQRAEELEALEKAQLKQLIIKIAGGAVLLLVLLLFFKSLGKKKKNSQLEKTQNNWNGANAGGGIAYDIGDDGVLIPRPGGDPESEAYKASLEEQMKKNENESLTQIKTLVNKDSSLIAQLLRNWLSEDN